MNGIASDYWFRAHRFNSRLCVYVCQIITWPQLQAKLTFQLIWQHTITPYTTHKHIKCLSSAHSIPAGLTTDVFCRLSCFKQTFFARLLHISSTLLKGYSLYSRLDWPTAESIPLPIGISTPSVKIYLPCGSGHVIPQPWSKHTE